MAEPCGGRLEGRVSILGGAAGSEVRAGGHGGGEEAAARCGVTWLVFTFRVPGVALLPTPWLPVWHPLERGVGRRVALPRGPPVHTCCLSAAAVTETSPRAALGFLWRMSSSLRPTALAGRAFC